MQIVFNEVIMCQTWKKKKKEAQMSMKNVLQACNRALKTGLYLTPMPLHLLSIHVLKMTDPLVSLTHLLDTQQLKL